MDKKAEADKEDTLEEEEKCAPMDEVDSAKLEEVVKSYLNLPECDRAPLNIVIAGKGGVGKSTLINNMLGLQGSEAALTAFSQRPTTKGVSVYSKTICGVPVHIYDTPGLMEGRIHTQEVVDQIRKLTNGSISLVIYVSSLQGRLNDSDERIVQKLTDAFTSEIWQHTILVLSHADEVINKQGYAKKLNETVEDFEEFVRMQSGCQNLKVKCITETQEIGECPYDIPALATGLHRDCVPKLWHTHLMVLAFRTCNPHGITQLLIVSCCQATTSDASGGGSGGNGGGDGGGGDGDGGDGGGGDGGGGDGGGAGGNDGDGITGALKLGGVTGSIAGGTIGGIIASVAGASTTTVISVSPVGASILGAITSLTGLTPVAPVVVSSSASFIPTLTTIATAASATSIGVGMAIGSAGLGIVGIASALAFKKYAWPAIRRNFSDS